MKNSFFCSLFFLLIVAAAPAQRTELPARIEWGEELREPAGTYLSKIISTSASGFYALRRKNSNMLTAEQIYLEFYDGKMNLKRSQKIDLRYKGKQRDFENVVMLGGQLFLLTSFNNQAKKKNYLFVQKVSKRFTPSKELKMISEIPTRNKEREGNFDLVVSRDSSKVLIYSQLPYRKNEPERFALQIFNDHFETIWNRDITLPYSDEGFSVEEYRIDKEGNVYLLGVIFRDRTRIRRKGKPTYQYTILVYAKGGEEVQEYKIDLGEKFVTDLTFRIANNGHLVCSGFYSEKGTYSIKGTCFFRLDTQSKQIYNKNLKKFDFEFLTQYLPKGQKEKARKAEQKDNANKRIELYRYSLDELILRSDGGVVLVAEQYYVYERVDRYYDGSLRYDYFYHYNDIIVVNIRPDGEIDWAARIPKRQETMNDGGYYSSYAMSIVRDRIFFIYNDNSRNFDRNSHRKYLYNFNGKYSVIALTEIKKDGTMATYPLFNNQDAQIITRPKVCKQTGSKKMMVYGEKGRNYRFANLGFK